MKFRREHQLKLPKLYQSPEVPRTKIKKLTQEERKAIIKRRHKDQYDEENVTEDDFLTTS